MPYGSRKRQFSAGLRAGLPIFIGYIPIGIVFAIMARQAGLSVWETCAMSLLVYAGASQMMAAGMVARGAGLAAVVLATFVLNLRHLIMSTCVMNRMEPAPLGLKLLGSFGVTDESFAVFTTDPKAIPTIWYFLGLGVSIYLSWNLGTLAGALAMDFLPPLLTASLGIALYAMFLSLLVPHLPGNGRLALLVLLTAVCNTLLCRVMASSWALIVSTLLCAFLGVFFVDLGEEDGNG